MSILCVSEASLDDVLQETYSRLLRDGVTIHPTKGEALEITGAVIELTDPRARVSRSAKRSRIFSALGELLWYMSGSDDLEFIEYYISIYPEFAVDGRVEGAYGPRLFGENHRLSDVVDLLRQRPSSRQAVVQIFAHQDLQNEKDVPCTTNIQFFIREGRLDMVTHMRSNDAYLGLPHDIFTFTMIQELVAIRLGVKLGTYKHFVGSLHLYARNSDDARAFIGEGWHPSTPMPSMPIDDLEAGVARLQSAEQALRVNVSVPALGDLGADYWDDLIRLLLALRASSETELNQIRASFTNDFFKVYLTDRLLRFEETSAR
ncbi:thymidylate synthase [Okibacterium fritillariae]|uniref:thymidylate synthase n=1 Tax=Okibacterium fritillariae TaxID=123320 RepID=UPI004055908F